MLIIHGVIMKFTRKEYTKIVDNEFGKFNRVEHKRSMRQDLHALSLLDVLFKTKEDMLCCIELDRVCLGITDKEVNRLTVKEATELIRCGVMVDWSNDSLFMIR